MCVYSRGNNQISGVVVVVVVFFLGGGGAKYYLEYFSFMFFFHWLPFPGKPLNSVNTPNGQSIFHNAFLVRKRWTPVATLKYIYSVKCTGYSFIKHVNNNFYYKTLEVSN